MRYDGELFLQSVLSEWAGDHRVRHYHGCWVCAQRWCDPHERRRCAEVSGRKVDAHHVLPKRILKRELDRRRFIAVDAMLLDPRNGIPVRRYHHDALERRMLEVPLSALPKDAVEFAEELGLLHILERLHPPMVVDPA